MRSMYKLLLLMCMALVSCENMVLTEKWMMKEITTLCREEQWGVGDTGETIDKIIAIIEENPHSLDYRFAQWEGLRKHSEASIPFVMITARDGNVRVFSFEQYGFEGNPSLGMATTKLVQYRVNDTVYCKRWEDEHSYVRRVGVIPSFDKTYYLLIDRGGAIAQGEWNEEWVAAYSVDAEQGLVPQRIFVSTGDTLSKIEVSWTDYANVDGKEWVSELHGIRLGRNAVGVPFVSDYNVVTEGVRKYYWNGTYFVDAGVRPVEEIVAEDNHVQICVLADGSYQYKCWDTAQYTSETPRLIINNGVMECWNEDGICAPNAVRADGVTSAIKGRDYIFHHEGYEYRVKMGFLDGPIRCLDIYKDDKLLKSMWIEYRIF